MASPIIINWKTTAAGSAAILTGIVTALNAYGSGAPIDWGSVLSLVVPGIIGIFAKDANVTGGTVPATPEAKSRV